SAPRKTATATLLTSIKTRSSAACATTPDYRRWYLRRRRSRTGLRGFSSAWDRGEARRGSSQSVRENSSFAPLGLDHFLPSPRLTPWTVFFRRFAARNPCLVPPRIREARSHAHTRSPLQQSPRIGLLLLEDLPVHLLRRSRLGMLGLPAHCGRDACAPAGMIVENELLER